MKKLGTLGLMVLFVASISLGVGARNASAHVACGTLSAVVDPSTPVSSTIHAGTMQADFTHIAITAGAGCDVHLKTMHFRVSGDVEGLDILSNFTLYDVDTGIVYGSVVAASDSDSGRSVVIEFDDTNTATIAADTTRVFAIKADIADASAFDEDYTNGINLPNFHGIDANGAWMNVNAVHAKGNMMTTTAL